MVEIKGFQYQISKLDARRQFHLVRKLAPVLAGLVEATLQAPGQPLTFALIAGPLAQKISDMRQDDVDYILTTCLAVCSRVVNGQPAPVQAAGTDKLMFPDIDMPVMLQLTMAAIEENLGDFLGSAQQEPKTQVV